MRDVSIILFAILSVVLLPSAAPSADRELTKIEGAKPLNVVFILSDDRRYDVMNFLRHPWIETPAMRCPGARRRLL